MVSAGHLHVVRRDPLADGPAGGRRAVLVHGAMDRASSFTRLMARMPDWTIVTYDRRGYAHSAPAGPPDRFEVQVEDFLDVLDGEPAVVFGHSLGADIVLAAAQRHSALLPTVLVWEPPMPWMPWWPAESASAGLGSDMEPEEQAEWFMRRMVGDRIWDRLPSATQAQRRAEGPTLQADMEALRHGPLFDPAQIRVPVIVGRGGKSSAHQRRGVRELAASIRRAEMVELADCGHGVHLSHPAELAALMARAAARG